MLKTILIGFVLITATATVADTSLGTIIRGDTQQPKIESHNKILRSKKTKKFRKDHHRYDKRYRDFDYDRSGYYNDDGFYFGFYDRSGYFFNNIYFEYDSRYTYRDRVYIRGNFAPTHHHYREYRHHRHNDWNRVHCYREPDEIVEGYYYEERYYPRDRGHYRDNRRNNNYNEYQRNSYRRDNYYRDNYRDNSYNYRDSYSRRSYQRDDAHIRRDRFSNQSSSRHRESNYRRDNNANIRRDRFSKKKESKSSGRLQITK